MVLVGARQTTPPEERFVESVADAHLLARRLSRAGQVAIDTEFHAERRFIPELCLIQLGLPDGSTWVVDPLVPGVLDCIRRPLRHTSWVLHGGHHDMQVLSGALSGLPDVVWDTQIAHGLVTHRWPISYAELLSVHLNHRAEKRETLSNWKRRPLHPEQLEYAREDVRHLLTLWGRLRRAAVRLGRMGIVADACDDARARIVDPDDPMDAWRRIGSARVLSRQQVAVLQELAAWRLQTARLSNRPPRTLATDGVLFDLARRQPESTLEILDNRRISHAAVKKHGEALVACIRRGRERDPDSWPRHVRIQSPEERSTTWVGCMIASHGHAHDYGAELVMSPERIRRLLVAPPPSRDGLALQIGPWRDALCGDLLWNALHGRVDLRMHNGDVQTIAPQYRIR